MPLEVVRLLQCLRRVLELTGGRRRAPGVALGRAVVGKRLQYLFELAQRAVEIAARQRIGRLLSFLFDPLRLLRWQRLDRGESVILLCGGA